MNNKRTNDNKEDPNKLWIKEDVYNLSKCEIPCRDCGKKDLKVERDINGNDYLVCEDCGRGNYSVIVELHEGQRIKANIDDIHEAIISKKCRKCRENLEYSGRNIWERFSDRNQWSCQSGCTRKKEFQDFQKFSLKRGKASVSIYDILPSEKVEV